MEMLISDSNFQTFIQTIFHLSKIYLATLRNTCALNNYFNIP